MGCKLVLSGVFICAELKVKKKKAAFVKYTTQLHHVNKKLQMEH